MRLFVIAAIPWIGLVVQALADPVGKFPGSAGLPPQSSSLSPFATANSASSSDIEAAEKIVKSAIASMTKLNKARLDKPARNIYRLRPGTSVSARKRDDETPPPLLEITDEISKAAALLSSLEGVTVEGAGTTAPKQQKRATKFWLETIGKDHKGSVPWGKDSSYKVFRNVVDDYGADPTGSKDATAAIQKAISDGKRCGAKCNGSTTKNAIVYFPPGRYKVSSSISVYFGTQIIGDANDPPTIVAAGSFVGLGVMSTDVYVDGGGNGPDGNALEWYINTSRFYSQIRNLKFDIRAAPKDAYVAALHYQVAQATTLENVEFIANSTTTQQGIFAENGSGGVMSDLTFTGGNFGIYGGSQQFSASRLTFNGCNTAVQIIWDWGWVWKNIVVNKAKVGFRLYNDADKSLPGSITLVDTVFSGTGSVAIEMATPAETKDAGFTGLVLDNVRLDAKINDPFTNKQILASGDYKYYVMGATYKDDKRSWTKGAVNYTRESSLLGKSNSKLPGAPYFEQKRHQYETKTASDFVHLKNEGAKGDGSTDDTSAVQKAFNKYKDGSKIIYVDAGTYILKETVTIPSGVKLVGETWSQFAAAGSKFGDMKKPIPMFKVGNKGDVGSVEMQDLILTSKGSTPGLICMEWNLAAESQGSAALWDVHVRLGGATGTDLTPAKCPSSTTATNGAACQVASMLLHVTQGASGYFENMWLWVADHMIDDPLLDDAMNNMDQLSVYSARGALIESRNATWLYGTASEHSVMYQYNFNGAQSIFTTMIQTESPYYQPTPMPPAPFKDSLSVFAGDRSYSCPGTAYDGCDESWAVIMKNCQNIHVGAAGTYSWFSTYTQNCIDKHSCQKALWLLDGNYNNNLLQNIVAIGAKNILVSTDGKTAISSTDNQAVSAHPAWAHISLYQVPSKGKAPDPEQPAEACPKRWYSSTTMPETSIEIWSNDGTKLDYAEDRDGSQSVTIVNLTPYKFVNVSGPEPYQFDKFDFGDVPSGKARKNEIIYDLSLTTDFTTTNGYAYYQIEGTSKTFRVHVTQHMDDKYERRVVFMLDGMGLGQRELGFPGEGVSVALVIAGSEEYGYISSLNLQKEANWMNAIYDVIKDRDLRHVIVPGSHDAGMSRISSTDSHWTGAGVPANTETQSLDIYNQLVVGSRYFDMRIVSIQNDEFWAAHVSDEHADVPIGATGESLDDLIKGVNRFTAEYPGEVIVWYIKYMVNFNIVLTSGRDWDADTANRFYTALEKINNRCIGLEKEDIDSINRLPAKKFMDANSKKGCVLLLTDANLNDGVPRDKVSSGIYSGPKYFLHDDYWAEEQRTRQNADKQIARMQSRKRDGNAPLANDGIKDGSDDYLITQWQVTPDAAEMADPPTIQLIANQETNPALYHYGFNAISPEYFPTVILHDAVGLFHVSDLDAEDYNPMMQALVIGLNLYMVSQNCKTWNGTNPLAGSKAMKSLTSSSSQRGQRGAGFSPFKGVIFANGTVLDEIPTGFCLTCTFNDTVAIDHPPGSD